MSNKCYLTEVVILTKSYNLQDFKDWLHWHLDIIGFDHCHVFDNESSVDIKSVCDSYCDKVTYELVKGWPNQYVLYNRYINHESPAWWVLPIDDDEFLYVSDKYHNNVNEMLLTVSVQHNDWNKICVGWRNLFPKKYIEERTNEHLILNAAEFIDAMYRRRLRRMDILQEDPIFILEWEHLDYNKENFMKLLNTDLKYKVVVITNNEKFKDTKKDNLLVIYDPAEKGPKGLFPAQFAEKYADTILKFIHNK